MPPATAGSPRCWPASLCPAPSGNSYRTRPSISATERVCSSTGARSTCRSGFGMRRSRATGGLGFAVTALATACPACAVSLDHEFDDKGAAEDAASDATIAQATGCALLAGAPGVHALSGDARSLPLPEGGSLWVVDQAVVGGSN